MIHLYVHQRCFCGLQVARLFNEAAQMSPDDADVHIVLGVLFNLSREYDKAIASFQTALKLKPHDYSLWNKLGATQANSVQSADAILAYQKVFCKLLTHQLNPLSITSFRFRSVLGGLIRLFLCCHK